MSLFDELTADDQVQAVRRKLVASLNKDAIDAAVEAFGYDRAKIEEILVLCGGADELNRRWNAFRRTPAQEAKDATHSAFELEEFITYLREQVAKEQQHGRKKKRKQRGVRRRHR